MMTDKEDHNVKAEEGELKNNSVMELSRQESAKKQRKNEVVVAPSTLTIKEQIRMAAYELYKMEKRLTKLLFSPWNRSYLESEDKREKKTIEGRIIIKDEGHKLIQENTIVTTTTTTTRKGKEKMDSDEAKPDYALKLIHCLVAAFMDYIDNIDEMASHEQKSEDDWIRYFEDGNKVFGNVNETLKKLLTYDMLGIKVGEIMCKLEEMNTFLNASHSIGIVTERDLTGIELWTCSLHMARCRMDLEELERVVKLLIHDFEYGTKV